jgi:N utilization substance protein B
MATFELLELSDVPTAVVISEAVDLAKQYSTDESGRFVNGVLAAVAGEVRTGA